MRLLGTDLSQNDFCELRAEQASYTITRPSVVAVKTLKSATQFAGSWYTPQA